MPLTDKQKTASLHYKGPALTLAIPGSGKTTLLLHRLAHLVKAHQVAPSEILTLTFSKASAEDMKARYDAQLGHESPLNFPFMTIHKFAYGIYQTYLRQKGKHMTLIDDGHMKFKALSEVMRTVTGQTLSEEDFETLSSNIGLIYNLMLKRDEVHLVNSPWENIFDLAEGYHLYKKKHDFFDFDDMLLDAIKILKKNDAWLAHLRSQYRFIQVDEAQDTSKLQYALIELLLTPEQNLFLVADDDQSIYGFRGAFPKYLLDFPSRYPGASVYYLSENFRSDANIVKTATGIIEKNAMRYPKEILPTKPAKAPIPIRIFSDVTDRNRFLLKQLSQAKGTKAVLYRNKISALSLIDGLENAGLAFQIKEAPLGELRHWILTDLLAFFHLIMIPQDLESFNRIAFKTNGFISKEMKQYVNVNHRGRNVFDVLVSIPFLEDYQTRTQERIKANFETLAALRPFDAIHYIETELGYLDYIKTNATRLGITVNFARTRLDAYKTIAKPLKSIFDFINRVDVLDTFMRGLKDGQSQDITLSTLHGSKGLEFDHVYMIDVNPQIFPGFKATEKAALEEERRLFYVGITRAKASFELLHSEFINGGFNAHSSFIDELLTQPLTDHRFHNVTGKSASH